MSTPFTAIQQPIRAVRMAIFPTYDTPEQALAFAQSQLPIKDQNTLCSVIFAYHNTLLKLQEQSK